MPPLALDLAVHSVGAHPVVPVLVGPTSLVAEINGHTSYSQLVPPVRNHDNPIPREVNIDGIKVPLQPTQAREAATTTSSRISLHGTIIGHAHAHVGTSAQPLDEVTRKIHPTAGNANYFRQTLTLPSPSSEASPYDYTVLGSIYSNTGISDSAPGILTTLINSGAHQATIIIRPHDETTLIHPHHTVTFGGSYDSSNSKLHRSTFTYVEEKVSATHQTTIYQYTASGNGPAKVETMTSVRAYKTLGKQAPEIQPSPSTRHSTAAGTIALIHPNKLQELPAYDAISRTHSILDTITILYPIDGPVITSQSETLVHSRSSVLAPPSPSPTHYPTTSLRRSVTATHMKETTSNMYTKRPRPSKTTLSALFSASTTVNYASQSTVWTFDGCYSDTFSHRLLVSKVSTRINMTVDTCAISCLAYSYFGVENMDCYCGNEAKNAILEVSQSDCSILCPGSSTQYCGGRDLISIYKKDSAPKFGPKNPSGSRPTLTGIHETHRTHTKHTISFTSPQASTNIKVRTSSYGLLPVPVGATYIPSGLSSTTYLVPSKRSDLPREEDRSSTQRSNPSEFSHSGAQEPPPARPGQTTFSSIIALHTSTASPTEYSFGSTDEILGAILPRNNSCPRDDHYAHSYRLRTHVIEGPTEFENHYVAKFAPSAGTFTPVMTLDRFSAAIASVNNETNTIEFFKADCSSHSLAIIANSEPGQNSPVVISDRARSGSMKIKKTSVRWENSRWLGWQICARKLAIELFWQDRFNDKDVHRNDCAKVELYAEIAS